MSWTTPEQITTEVEKRWRRGEILAARVTGEPIFPLQVRLRRPNAREVAERFGDVLDWVRRLDEASLRARGYGFDLLREEVRSRVQGANELPVAAVIPTESDALRLIRTPGVADRFQAVVDASLARYPALQNWLTRRPLTALDHAARWVKVLSVLDWFAANPRPGLYLRQLDIPGVDTKFIEAHRGLLTELLDIVLPEMAIDRTAVGVRGFNARYGLRSEPPLVRFRLVDPALHIQGLSDLSLPPEQFATLSLPVRRVFVTENRTNGLSFPDCPGSMVVFGLGYGLQRLTEVAWLRDVDVHYWGDIDTHGFGILNRLRSSLPSARSFLMDRATLEAHRPLWGDEPAEKRYAGDTGRLTTEEHALFEDLTLDRFGERVRLEQERISYRWLEAALRDRAAGLENQCPPDLDV
ncbi:MAG: hypothetical protein GEU90_14250 [Gemmatimonas sp.]|nr:hypothetical protein [Gemmatimonas sp.]